MNQNTRIEKLGEMEFMGVAMFGNPEQTAFHNAWNLFGEIANKDSISLTGKDIYGLQLYHPAFPKKFELTYMACMQRLPDMEIPIRMISKKIPACTYAVQKVQGGIDGIDKTIMNLYQEYIPNNGYTVAMPFDFEKYKNVLDSESVPKEIEFWVPVKKM